MAHTKIGGSKILLFRKSIRYLCLCLALSAFLFCGCGLFQSSSEWALDTIKKYYYEDLPEDYVYDGDIESFVNKYLDIYSAYYTAEEYKSVVSSNAGNKSGVGLSITYINGESVTHPSGKSGLFVERVVGNSPAAKAGISAGEFITSATSGEKTETFSSYSDFSAFLAELDTGEEFTLTTDINSYTVSKEEYTASYCSMATSEASYTVLYDSDGEVEVVKDVDGGYTFLPEGAAYIKLDQFYGNAATEMALLMKEYNAENCTSLILDLRGDGGGYVSVMADISYIFTDKRESSYSAAMYAVYKDGSREETGMGTVSIASSDCYFLPADAEVSVLADCGTASASEALIGVLYCYGVIGYEDIYISDFSEEYDNYLSQNDYTRGKNRRTYGKGIMQATYTKLGSGEALKLTVAKIYWPDGQTSIHDTGLNVSLGCRTVSAEWDVTYGDEQLKRAVSLIYS